MKRSLRITGKGITPMKPIPMLIYGLSIPLLLMPADVRSGEPADDPKIAIKSAETNHDATPGGSMDHGHDELVRKAMLEVFGNKHTGGAWGYVGRALASYWLGRSDMGDATIRELFHATRPSDGSRGKEVGHWQIFQVARIVALFGGKGTDSRGRMGAEAERMAMQIMWDWLSPIACQELIDPARDWWIWESENHHLQAWFSMWGALLACSRDPVYAQRGFADGSTVLSLKMGFDAYFKRWIRNRATRGIFVECNSPTYAKYSLSGFYNFVDFADDAELKDLARRFLDLCWSQWSLEQMDGYRGGSRHRCYAGDIAHFGGSLRGLAGYHFGVGESGTFPAGWCTATSTYEPPALVQEIVRRRPGLGEYQMDTRLPGLLESVPQDKRDPPRYASGSTNPMSGHNVYALDPSCGSILRRTFVAPSFILGATMVEVLPNKRWSNISSQNRWDGVIFSGKPGSCIYFQPHKAAKGSLYNTQWSVMDRGTLMIQRLKGDRPSAEASQVFFSSDLVRTEKQGWIFVEAKDAYAAIRIVEGGGSWAADTKDEWKEENHYKSGLGEWLVVNNRYSPVIVEVVAKERARDMAAFQDRIASSTIVQSADALTFTSPFYGSSLTLPLHSKGNPSVNGKAIDFAPKACFDGPHLKADFGETQAVLTAFGKTIVFDFTVPGKAPGDG